MNGWDHLAAELDAWAAAGRIATFWWRDDDATRVTPALQRLLDIASRTRVPVALAVIPRDADDGLCSWLSDRPIATVLQHGFAHANHAPDDQRQEEYGPHRPRPVMLAELADGWRRLGRFDRALPVLVAPWNRMDEDLVPQLPKAGLGAVSSLGPRSTENAAPGVRRTNVHVDIVDWGGTGGFVGEDSAIAQLLDHLRARRAGTVDAGEPTGLMSHHLFHDEGCWQFVEAVLQRTQTHPAVRWHGAREAFWP